MTLAALRSQARRYARVDTTAADDDQLNLLIQDAVDKFSRDVGGFPEDVNLAIAAAFDTETTFAFHLTITDDGSETVDSDVVITSTAREDATGTTVASDLQTALQAVTGALDTVAWANFYFTLTFASVEGVTTRIIELAAPTTTTYVDALEILGFSESTSTNAIAGYTFTGSFPPDCTQYVTLPSDAVSVERVEWDYNELIQTGLEYVQSSEAQGDPTHYAVRGRRIYLVPSPDEQDRLEVWYRGLPTAITFASDTDVPSEIPDQYQEALVWLTATYLAYEQFDYEIGDRCERRYLEIMRRYRQDYANYTTTIEDNAFRKWPRVPSVLARRGLNA